MSAPLVWIVFPGLLAVLLLFLQRWERVNVLIGTLAALGLAGLALWLPAQVHLTIGSWTLTIVDTLEVLGRRFTLGGAERPAVVTLYLAAALWFGAAYVARPGRLFVSLGLGIVALLTAAIAVQPFLYAALLLEMATLLGIPLLVPRGALVGRGVLRYLTYRTLGMPFILFTGWILTGVETAPSEPVLPIRLALMIGLGFTLILGLFPFHTWLPMLAQEAHLYSVGFILTMLPGAILFFGLSFLDQFTWLWTLENMPVFIRAVGIFMVVFAGAWAAFQHHLGRILAYAVLLEIGLSLVVIGLGDPESAGFFQGQGTRIEILFADLLPRGLSLGVWALSLAIFQAKVGGVGYADVRGAGRRLPMAIVSLLMANFAIAGLPLLASFPPRLALLEELAQVSLSAAYWVLFGMVGLMVAGLRTLAVLVSGNEEEGWQSKETWVERIYLVLGMIGLVVVGLFPQWFLPFFANLPRLFAIIFPRLNFFY